MTDKQQPEALQYANRDHMALGDYYLRHVSAMTGEALHAKSAIAAELAHRDREIDKLHAELETLRTGYAAARLEIESLKAQLAAQQPGGAYEALPEPHFGKGRYLGLANDADAYSVAQVNALFASHGQAPAQAAPEGWVTWWPSPSAAGHEPVYSHGPKEPGYGAKLDAMLRKYPVFAKPTTQPAPNEDEGISREQWIEQAMRVYLIAGDTEQQAEECAKYLWGELDLDDLADPYDAAMSDVEGRGPAPQPSPAAQGDALDAERWRMAALVGNEVMVHPDKRNHAAAVAAYMQAVSSGLDLTAAIDAARAAQEDKQ